MSSELSGRPQSWQLLPPGAKAFISFIAALGTAVLVYGLLRPSSRNTAEFVCYLGVAILASRLRVNLPGIAGTMTMSFLFVLLGILQLSFSETLVLGCTSILVRWLYPDRPDNIQCIFNL